MAKILARGAEAVLILNKNNLIKQRVEKGYRLKEIDISLRKRRTRKEVKLLKQIDFAPNVFNVDDFNIEMEFIKGNLIKDILDDMRREDRKKVCIKIGKNIAVLHDREIIHGDLTTSNMIYKNGKVYFIDFGLGFNSKKLEDKAVDLHLLKQAFDSKHYKNCDELFKNVVEGYKMSKNYRDVLERLEKVNSRGRYKGRKK